MADEDRAAGLEVISAALASGQSVAAVARTLQVSESTVYRRARMPEVQELVAEQRREAARQIRDGIIGGALVGIQRLIDVASDPETPAGPAVSASRHLVDLAIGPGGLGALTAALERAERAAEPEPEESAVEVIRRRLDEINENQRRADEVLSAVERFRPVWGVGEDNLPG